MTLRFYYTVRRVHLSEKILDSKIQIPIRFRNFIAREELLEILKDSSEKVIVLNAGAGFGKTMLLTYYAVESQDKCAWYHLSPLDNDIMTFIKYLSCSLNKVLSGFNFNFDNQSNLSGNELIESIANEFAIYISQFSEFNISILLDDFQEINNEEIYNFLSILINNTNENLRLMMATKGSFPKFLARYLLQGSAMMINDRKLAFNREEVLRILNDIRTINDINLCADFILDYTEGWPAGVIAIALSLRNERKTIDKDEIIALCKESKVYDYVMYEIFKKLPFDIQTFLIHTSVLNILSTDLCNAVMNTTTAKGTLDYLVQENIFVIMLSGKGNVYRYHSIFKDYLSSQISKSVELEILKKAAIYCLNKGDYEQAAEYAISCNDVDLMQTAFELTGLKMVQLGETLTLNRWIDYLNASNAKLTARTKKVLSSYYYSKKDPVKAYEFIESACEDFKQEGNENEFVEAILQKIGYLEEQYELSLCMKEITAALAFVKRKFSVNWYILQSKKLELQLLLYNEADAVSTADEIVNGTMLYIRGGKEAVVVSIRDSAGYVAKVGKLHLKEEDIFPNEMNIPSRVIFDYCSWCSIQSLYRKQEEGKAYDLAVPYLEQLQTNDIFTAYIKILGCVILLHQGRTEEADSLMMEADKFFSQYQIEFPKLLKEDSRLLKETYQFSVSKKGNSKIFIKCFDNGTTFIDNQSQEIKWRTKKTYELFAYLFEKQGKAISKDNIISVLWPDMPLDKAAILFHTTISYLRKSLAEQGLNDLLQSKSNGYLLDNENIESDYDQLTDIYQKVQGRQYKEIDTPLTLIDLYKAPYFDNIAGEWVINKREHLERIYITCCKELAEYLIDNFWYQESAEILAKVIKLDPYSEELLVLIMKAFGALGDYKSVKAYYEEAKRVMKQELDSEISSEIQDLYDEIIHKKSKAVQEA
jgi:two-component SAPR family response regulator